MAPRAAGLPTGATRSRGLRDWFFFEDPDASQEPRAHSRKLRDRFLFLEPLAPRARGLRDRFSFLEPRASLALSVAPRAPRARGVRDRFSFEDPDASRAWPDAPRAPRPRKLRSRSHCVVRVPRARDLWRVSLMGFGAGLHLTRVYVRVNPFQYARVMYITDATCKRRAHKNVANLNVT